MMAEALKLRDRGSLARAWPGPAPRVVPVARAVANAGLAVESAPPTAELVTLDQVLRHRLAWEALVRRALEPNVFLEPAFAIAAAQHFAVSQRPRFLLVWAAGEAGGPRMLIGLCPLASIGALDAGLTRGWMTRQAALGTPLLDREHAATALAAMLGHVAARLRGGAVLFPKIPQDGPTAGLVRSLAAAGGLELRLLGQHRRACLSGGAAGEALSAFSPFSPLGALGFLSAFGSLPPALVSAFLPSALASGA